MTEAPKSGRPGGPAASDPLGPLVELPGVREAAEKARDDIAAVHMHRTNRRGWRATAAEASVRAARSSSALDGGSMDLPEPGTAGDPVLAGALRVGQALDGEAGEAMVATWRRAPGQALARLHLLAAADLVGSEALGRLRTDDGVGERVDLLLQLVSGGTSAPAPVLAAVVHGELASLRPFGSADGVVARAASRLVCVSTGFDNHDLAVPEVAWMRRPAEYRERVDGFASGTADGVGQWILFCCNALIDGAREATSIADAFAP